MRDTTLTQSHNGERQGKTYMELLYIVHQGVLGHF